MLRSESHADVQSSAAFSFFIFAALYFSRIPSDAVMHLYTHDHLWPQLSDLAAELGTECQLLDSDSGGNCFDEVCSFPWQKLGEYGCF